MDEYLDELSSGAPVPGGGSVAALTTALGASLLVMVTNLTIGRKRYQSVEEQVRLVQARAIAHSIILYRFRGLLFTASKGPFLPIRGL